MPGIHVFRASSKTGMASELGPAGVPPVWSAASRV